MSHFTGHSVERRRTSDPSDHPLRGLVGCGGLARGGLRAASGWVAPGVPQSLRRQTSGQGGPRPARAAL
eukprot:3812425-Prymnesium_polylepis.1